MSAEGSTNSDPWEPPINRRERCVNAVLRRCVALLQAVRFPSTWPPLSNFRVARDSLRMLMRVSSNFRWRVRSSVNWKTH
jgi:hypothetical protein